LPTLDLPATLVARAGFVLTEAAAKWSLFDTRDKAVKKKKK